MVLSEHLISWTLIIAILSECLVCFRYHTYIISLNPHFTEEKMGPERWSHLYKVIQIVSLRPGFTSILCDFPIHTVFKPLYCIAFLNEQFCNMNLHIYIYNVEKDRSLPIMLMSTFISSTFSSLKGYTVVKSMRSGPSLSRLESRFYDRLAMWPCEGYFTTLSLGLLLCKTATIREPLQGAAVGIIWGSTCKVLRVVPAIRNTQ